MDAELATPKKKVRKKFVAPRLGDIPLSKAALSVLKGMDRFSGTIQATRRFPHDWSFTLLYPVLPNPKGGDPIIKPSKPLTNAMVDVLVRTGCISTDDDLRVTDVARWCLTVKGVNAANSKGFDSIPQQVGMFEDPTE